MNVKDQKIKLKTVFIWMLYSLKIEEIRSPVDVKYPNIVYKYHFKVRYIPAILFFIGVLPVLILLHGIYAVPGMFKELFRNHNQGDLTEKLDTKMTRVFAYNRF